MANFIHRLRIPIHHSLFWYNLSNISVRQCTNQVNQQNKKKHQPDGPDVIDVDKDCVIFHNNSPQAPVHFLVVAKRPVQSINDCTEDDAKLLSHMLLMAKRWGKILSPEGFRVVINCGDQGGQKVNQLHFHVLGGRQLLWPPG